MLVCIYILYIYSTRYFTLYFVCICYVWVATETAFCPQTEKEVIHVFHVDLQSQVKMMLPTILWAFVDSTWRKSFQFWGCWEVSMLLLSLLESYSIVCFHYTAVTLQLQCLHLYWDCIPPISPVTWLLATCYRYSWFICILSWESKCNGHYYH